MVWAKICGIHSLSLNSPAYGRFYVSMVKWFLFFSPSLQLHVFLPASLCAWLVVSFDIGDLSSSWSLVVPASLSLGCV